MPRKFRAAGESGRRILLVDDDPEYLEIMGRILRNEGHEVASESSGRAALARLRDNAYDLLLIDYYMPGMTGEELITAIRKNNDAVQIILQTGYANEQPPRELVKRLDIQGYFNKSEGPDKLLLWVDVGLKSAYNLAMLHRSRAGLRYILNATPELHRIQSLDELLQGILLQVSGLLGAADSFLAVLPEEDARPAARDGGDGFVATMDEESRLLIRAGTGRYADRRELSAYLEPAALNAIQSSLDENRVMRAGLSNVVPMSVGDARIGVICFEQETDEGANAELLRVFADQAAVAIHNARLYAMATLDPLTGVYQKGMFVQALLRELRVSLRSGSPLCLIMADVDGMQALNDAKGRAAGDRALAMVGGAMRYATRQSDIRGRVGGDRFSILLVNSTEPGASIVLERMRSYLASRSSGESAVGAPVSCGMGAAVLSASEGLDGASMSGIGNAYFQWMARSMIDAASGALEEEKGASAVRAVEWLPFEEKLSELGEDDYGFR